MWHADLLHKLKSYEFRVGHLALFCLFSAVNGFEWFWMGSFCKSIQLMLEFLKVPFLVPQLPYYILMTFLMMLSVILLSMVMIPHSTISVIRHLQSFSKYCETFWYFIKFCSQHKWKWWAIITYKHGIYEFPHELPNDLRLRIIEN